MQYCGGGTISAHLAFTGCQPVSVTLEEYNVVTRQGKDWLEQCHGNMPDIYICVRRSLTNKKVWSIHETKVSGEGKMVNIGRR